MRFSRGAVGTDSHRLQRRRRGAILAGPSGRASRAASQEAGHPRRGAGADRGPQLCRSRASPRCWRPWAIWCSKASRFAWSWPAASGWSPIAGWPNSLARAWPRVSWGPWMTPSPYYAAADLYVQPTFYDPCSLVVLEALASGPARDYQPLQRRGRADDSRRGRLHHGRPGQCRRAWLLCAPTARPAASRPNGRRRTGVGHAAFAEAQRRGDSGRL